MSQLLFFNMSGQDYSGYKYNFWTLKVHFKNKRIKKSHKIHLAGTFSFFPRSSKKLTFKSMHHLFTLKVFLPHMYILWTLITPQGPAGILSAPSK